MSNLHKILLFVLIFLISLTVFNLIVAYSCYVSYSCESAAETQCNWFCAGAGGCEGVHLYSDWCCGSQYCCSEWILICSNWPSFGKWTCYNYDSGCLLCWPYCP